jgi:hypothetical protein
MRQKATAPASEQTAGDLLLDLDHPNIALGKAIVKGHREGVQISITASWCVDRRSSRLSATDCLCHPRLLASGGGSGGVA